MGWRVVVLLIQPTTGQAVHAARMPSRVIKFWFGNGNSESLHALLRFCVGLHLLL